MQRNTRYAKVIGCIVLVLLLVICIERPGCNRVSSQTQNDLIGVWEQPGYLGPNRITADGNVITMLYGDVICGGTYRFVDDRTISISNLGKYSISVSKSNLILTEPNGLVREFKRVSLDVPSVPVN